MKILLWKIGALGDVVMTTPLLRAVRRAHPGARIHYLVGRGSRAAIEGHPHVDEVRVFDEAILYGGAIGRLGEVLRELRGHDLVFTLDKHWIFPLLAWAARVPRRIGFRRRPGEGVGLTARVDYGALRHEIDYYLDLAVAAGLPVDRADRRLELPPAEPYAFAPPYQVVINSGGRNANEASDVRKMPAALLSALVDRLRERAPVVLLGGPDERALYAPLEGRPGVTNLCGATSLRQAWSLLARAEHVYTTDSGLMHMAGAVNPNVTAVFGPTHPLRKCPPGARAAWADEGLYDPRYELHGRVPPARYFAQMTVDRILEARPWPPSP